MQPIGSQQSRARDVVCALVRRGGFGAAKNLSSWAVDGVDCTVDFDVKRVVGEFHGAKKAIGACCIAPVLMAKVGRLVAVFG